LTRCRAVPHGQVNGETPLLLQRIAPDLVGDSFAACYAFDFVRPRLSRRAGQFDYRLFSVNSRVQRVQLKLARLTWPRILDKPITERGVAGNALGPIPQIGIWQSSQLLGPSDRHTADKINSLGPVAAPPDKGNEF